MCVTAQFNTSECPLRVPLRQFGKPSIVNIGWFCCVSFIWVTIWTSLSLDKQIQFVLLFFALKSLASCVDDRARCSSDTSEFCMMLFVFMMCKMMNQIIRIFSRNESTLDLNVKMGVRIAGCEFASFWLRFWCRGIKLPREINVDPEVQGLWCTEGVNKCDANLQTG